jgi:hypothetical protein
MDNTHEEFIFSSPSRNGYLYSSPSDRKRGRESHNEEEEPTHWPYFNSIPSLPSSSPHSSFYQSSPVTKSSSVNRTPPSISPSAYPYLSGLGFTPPSSGSSVSMGPSSCQWPPSSSIDPGEFDPLTLPDDEEGKSSANGKEEDRKGAPVGRPPAQGHIRPRSLDLAAVDYPYTQYRSPLFHSPSAAEQPSSSAVGVSSSPQPMLTSSGATSMCGQRQSAFSSPAAGSVAGDSGQLRNSTAAVWLTLPDLRRAVTASTEVYSMPLDEVQTTPPGILLGFHQDYPVVNGHSQVSYLVTWPGIVAGQGPLVTLELPFRENSVTVNPFFTFFQGQVNSASELLQPNPHHLHLVDVLFDMARINSHLAAIIDRIPVMALSELECYERAVTELIKGQPPHHRRCRFGERNIGQGITVELHVEQLLLKAKFKGSNSPAPPCEPVVFFTATRSDRHSPNPAQISHPILLPPPFIPNLLYATPSTGADRYEQRPSAESLASVTFNHLKTVSHTDAHWHTAARNLSPSQSDVMTVFSTSKESSSSTTEAPVPLIYRYLSNELNTLPSSSARAMPRERNIMSAAIINTPDPSRTLCRLNVSLMPPVPSCGDVLSPVLCSPCRRIWQTVTRYFHDERSTQQPPTPSDPTKEELIRMRIFIDSFLARSHSYLQSVPLSLHHQLV